LNILKGVSHPDIKGKALQQACVEAGAVLHQQELTAHRHKARTFEGGVLVQSIAYGESDEVVR
jgi:hypothetical protein